MEDKIIIGSFLEVLFKKTRKRISLPIPEEYFKDVTDNLDHGKYEDENVFVWICGFAKFPNSYQIELEKEYGQVYESK